MIKAGIAIIDLAIILILSIFIYRGYKNGFITELKNILSTTVGLVVAIRYMSDLAILIYGMVDISPVVITILCFILIFTTVTLSLSFVLKKFLKAIKFSIVLGSLDRLLGIAFGLAKGAIIISLVCALLSMATFSTSIKKEINQSLLFNPMRNVLPLAYSVAKLVFQTRYKPLVQEIEESFSGQPEERKGEAQDLIDYYRYK